MKNKILIIILLIYSLGLFGGWDTNVVKGQESSIILDNNFTGIWHSRNPVPEFSSTSLIACENLVECPQKNIHCNHNELYLVQTCDTCARCTKNSRTIILNLCLSEGQIRGTVQHRGILNKGTIISQTVFSTNNVVLNIQDDKGKSSTLTLKLLENGKKLHGTFSYGIGFNAKKSRTNSCL